MRQYTIFDEQAADYIANYGKDNEYWTLEEAQDLAYRKWEEAADEAGDGDYKEFCYNQMSKMLGNPSEIIIAMSLLAFDYELKKVEE